MKLKCQYCDHYITDTDERCPNCGAPNPSLKRNAVKIPQTIEELQAFAQQHNLPLEKMHFHLGEDYKEPKAFGIYKDDKGNFVVYKNKADGTRAVRYEGKDEAYAVNEIYQKMKAEIIEERQYSADHPVHKSGSGSGKNKRTRKSTTPSIMKILGIIFGAYMSIGIIIGIITAIFAGDVKNTGYYKYDDTLYYQRNGNWYYYDEDYGDWYATTVDDELNDNYDDYFESYSYDDSYGGSDYSSSDSYYDNYYDTDNNWDDDWDDDDWDYDSGSDWDSGWDSGYDSDWDSDW
jgi:hypothetical protein